MTHRSSFLLLCLVILFVSITASSITSPQSEIDDDDNDNDNNNNKIRKRGEVTSKYRTFEHVRAHTYNVNINTNWYSKM